MDLSYQEMRHAVRALPNAVARGLCRAVQVVYFAFLHV